jgi:hypothetical protein
MGISETILNKLKELESNKNVPFLRTDIVESNGLIWEESTIIHFGSDGKLYQWDKDYSGERRYSKHTLEIEISKDFSRWISGFAPLDREAVVKILMNEGYEVLKLRCERDNADFATTFQKIERELRICFGKLK